MAFYGAPQAYPTIVVPAPYTIIAPAAVAAVRSDDVGKLKDVTAFHKKLTTTLDELEVEHSRFKSKQDDDKKALLLKQKKKIETHAATVKKAFEKIPKEYRVGLEFEKGGDIEGLRLQVVNLRRKLEEYRDNN